MRRNRIGTTDRLEQETQDQKFSPITTKLSLVLPLFFLVAVSIGGGEAFSVDRSKSFASTTTPSFGIEGVSRKRSLVQIYQNRNENDDGGDNREGEENNDEKHVRQNHSSNNNKRIANLLAAAAFTVSSLGSNGNPIANAADLDLVSPGTAIIETKIADSTKLAQSTETTLNNLFDTALWNTKNRNELSDSLERIRSSINGEITSVEAWKEVTKILRDYGVDLRKETTIRVRPPADFKRALGDATTKKVSLLVNGEIVQIELDYTKGTNTKQNLEEGKPIQPDDEWTLRIKGYKGFDPDALAVPDSRVNPLFQYERPSRPAWFRKGDRYWHEPLAEKNPFGKIAKTHGDAIVLSGSTAIALSYAVSYAYYLDQIEQEELAAKKKKEEIAAKKKAEAKKKKDEENEKSKESPKKKGLFGRKKKETEKPKEEKPASKKVEKEPSESDDKPQNKVAEDPKPKKEEDKPLAADVISKDDEKGKETTAKETKPEPPKVLAENETPEEEEPKEEEEKPEKEETPKPKTPAPEGSKTEETEEEYEDDVDDDVKVTIEFDEDGKVVITAVDGVSVTDTLPKRGGPIAFAQALYLPWMGFFVSSRLDRDDRSKVVRFVQALLFPWVGILFRKEQSVSSVETSTTSANKDKKK